MSWKYHRIAIHSVCGCFTSCSVNSSVCIHSHSKYTDCFQQKLNLQINILFQNSDLMHCFSIAYQNKVLTVPLDWLAKILLYNSWQQLSTDLKYYGLVPDTQAQCIRFQRDWFLSSKPIVSSALEDEIYAWEIQMTTRKFFLLWIFRRNRGRSILLMVN